MSRERNAGDGARKTGEAAPVAASSGGDGVGGVQSNADSTDDGGPTVSNGGTDASGRVDGAGLVNSQEAVNGEATKPGAGAGVHPGHRGDQSGDLDSGLGTADSLRTRGAESGGEQAAKMGDGEAVTAPTEAPETGLPETVVEPSEPIDEPIVEQVRQMADEMAEPSASVESKGGSEMAEPLPQMAEPSPRGDDGAAVTKAVEAPETSLPETVVEPSELTDDDDEELDKAGAFDRERRLWNISTYKDRHGKLRAKRVLRFVANPPKPDIGIVTESLAVQLEGRKGRGRWADSRTDAEELKRVAQLVADAYWRDRGKRRGGKAVSKPKHAKDRAGKRGVLPNSQDDSRGAEVSDLPISWPEFLE